MANKLLKTLTIDGVARDIENCRFPKLSNDWLVDDLSIGTSMVSECYRPLNYRKAVA